MRMTCLPFEGCRGEGVLTDLTDSGSGRETYCDCEAGARKRWCMSEGYFDAGRGDEWHVCYLAPGHEGDHANSPHDPIVTWRRS